MEDLDTVQLSVQLDHIVSAFLTLSTRVGQQIQKLKAREDYDAVRNEILIQ